MYNSVGSGVYVYIPFVYTLYNYIRHDIVRVRHSPHDAAFGQRPNPNHRTLNIRERGSELTIIYILDIGMSRVNPKKDDPV